MNIKFVLHSELDCHLKPDIKLIKAGLESIAKSEIKNQSALAIVINKVEEVNALIEEEARLASKLKEAEKEDKPTIKAEKEAVAAKVDIALSEAVENLLIAGGKDAYHYDYDDHFNMVIAGLMGSTCYMKEDFKALQDKRITSILAISNVVLNNGHHSTFGHSHLTLEISGLPKALAMILNNEKEYTTSEKSARYTIMDQISPKELELYTKWKAIFEKAINDRYGKCQPFFDEKGIKTGKLAQENARYMISVFTPTNMVYTTSFRQLNYLAHWLEKEIANPDSNKFYLGIKKDMKEFVDFVKSNGLYLEKLEDHKDRSLSLFGPGALEENLSSESYTLVYNTSLACLAQAQRHRTIDYRVDDYLFRNGQDKFFIPPILNTFDDLQIVNEWIRDITSVAETIPQGKLVRVIENGKAKDFILKAKERECSEAQWEIMNLTRNYSQKFKEALDVKIAESEAVALLAGYCLDAAEFGSFENSIQNVKDMRDVFDKLSDGARCQAGYKCSRPCGFKEGIDLTRDI